MIINQIQKRAGIATFNFGIRMLRDAFKTLNPRIVNAGDVLNILKANGLNINTIRYDQKYYLTDWDNWLEFFKVFEEKLKYYYDVFDCDNMSFLTSSIAALFMNLNTCGTIYCKVYNNKTEKLIAGHLCNVIITKNNEVYIHDMNNMGGYVKYDSSKPTVIRGWRYEGFNNAIFF